MEIELSDFRLRLHASLNVSRGIQVVHLHCCDRIHYCSKALLFRRIWSVYLSRPSLWRWHFRERRGRGRRRRRACKSSLAVFPLRERCLDPFQAALGRSRQLQAAPGAFQTRRTLFLAASSNSFRRENRGVKTPAAALYSMRCELRERLGERLF